MRKGWGAGLLCVSLFMLAVFIKSPVTGLPIGLLTTAYVITFMAGAYLLSSRRS